jgi:pyruvate dehydrogenase E2 component (dihydrolipoamide acetyltransferase)
MTDVLMPALSPTMEEGTLAKWHVKPGDVVKSGDVIAEIETDKATMDVEAVDEGEIGDLLVKEGTEGVKVGAPIARMKGGEGAAPAPPPPAAPAEPETKIPPAEAAKPEPAAAPPRAPPPPASDSAPPTAAEAQDNYPPAPSVRRIAAESHLDLSTIKGTGRDGRITKGDVLGASTPHGDQGSRVTASPYARKLAAEKGFDLAAIKGSGPDGRIIERDVESFKPAAKAAEQPAGKSIEPPKAEAPAQAPPAASKSPTLEQMGIPAGSYDLVPLDGMRRTIAKRMTEASRDIPHFPLTVDLEIDQLLAARKTINELSGDIRVSVNDLIIKAAAMALMKFPQANASYSPEGLAFHHHADVAMAVAIEGGLITPIIRAAETKTITQIARETKDLVDRAKTRRLKPEEYLGGTFSVSNLGMFGIREFGSIINPPQGAILSVGAGERRAVVRKGDVIEVATIMSVTLTCDHRVVDGATGARWLQAFRTMIEKPMAMLA